MPIAIRFAAFLSIFLLAGSALAQDEPDEQPQTERDERMQVMQQLADQLKLFSADDRTEIKRIEKHLMRHNDATRNYQDGTIWAFGDKGRPAALMMIQTNDASSGWWWYAITSLTTDRMRLEHESQVRWTPTEAGVSMKPLSSDSPPARSRGLRLIQLRNLANRFTSHQFWDPDNQRYQLRLLRQPVHRYEDKEAGIIDGAIFAFVVNVHPELLLIIEAVDEDQGHSWRYSFAKLGSAEFHGQLDGEPVYSSPRAPDVTGNITDAYRLFSTRLDVKE